MGHFLSLFFLTNSVQWQYTAQILLTLTCFESWSTRFSRCTMRSCCLRNWVVKSSFSVRRLPMTLFSCCMWLAMITLSLLSIRRPESTSVICPFFTNVLGSVGLILFSMADNCCWSCRHSDLDSFSCFSRLAIRSDTHNYNCTLNCVRQEDTNLRAVAVNETLNSNPDWSFAEFKSGSAKWIRQTSGLIQLWDNTQI